MLGIELRLEMKSIAVQKKNEAEQELFRTKQAEQKSRQGEKIGGEQDCFLGERQNNFL
jgi:hypothetical protein